jgi:NADH dehydrogenase [ubiquinone] 1 alpha subcomplex assembly factor 7
METSLYGEGGYYTNNVRIGLQGADFYTASQSVLFAYTLSSYIHRCWKTFGEPKLLQMVEFGAGQGELFTRICERLVKLLPDVRIQYVIIESSAYLKSIQQERARKCIVSDNVHIQFDSPHPDVPTVVIANEVLDALPVERLRRTERGWLQQYVVVGEDGIRDEWLPADEVLSKLAEMWLPIPLNFEAEICTEFPSFFRRVVSCGNPIRAVFIDYGITREELAAGVRPRGTIRGYRQHQIVDVFSHPGQTDITADVYWDYATAVLQDLGLHAYPIHTQGQFLLENGILEIAEDFIKDRPELARRITSEIKHLILPGGMGERFSVLECLKG